MSFLGNSSSFQNECIFNYKKILKTFGQKLNSNVCPINNEDSPMEELLATQKGIQLNTSLPKPPVEKELMNFMEYPHDNMKVRNFNQHSLKYFILYM